MGKEATLWKYIREGMKPYWKAKRVENPIGAGTPDVYFTLIGPPAVMGWVELKHIPTWPKRPETIVKIDHFTVDQRLFFQVHGGAGANIRMLLQAEKDYFLIGWRDALGIGESYTRADFYDQFLYWEKRIDFSELAKYFKNNHFS